MKGIILAGGSGTRMYPMTRIYSKQLVTIYDKPLIYYPLSILLLAGIREILIISNEETIPLYKKLFGTGSQIGLTIEYAVQTAPNGIAESFIIGEKFIGGDPVSLILGDNIFYGKLDFFYDAVVKLDANSSEAGAIIFAYQVNDPERYGIVEFDSRGKAISIEEKPNAPKSNFAVPGLYVYDNKVVEISKNLQPSGRNELEITDVNRTYLEYGRLFVEKIGRGVAWLDTGTPESLLKASNFFGVIEDRQGLKVACIEEIAYQKGFINKEQFISLINSIPRSLYRDYLEKILAEQ